MPDKPKCPRCGKPMLFMHGCGWDYDRWICSALGCPGEIELDETTYPKEENQP